MTAWRKREISKLQAAADMMAGDGGYSIGTTEGYKASETKRNKMLAQGKYVELALQCGAWNQVYGNETFDKRSFMINGNFDIEKFAELIVKECADFIGKENYKVINGEKDYEYFSVTSNELLQKFGIENETV